jgi:bifunctional non-homologous end joining protein LigD
VERAARTRRADALVFEARDVLARLDRHGDLFAPVLEDPRQLAPAARVLAKLAA